MNDASQATHVDALRAQPPDQQRHSAKLQIPGASLYYLVRGAGPLLLILQGGAGDADTAAALADWLSHAFTVVTYDRRGQARSPLDDPGQHSGIETHATDAHLLLAALTSEPAYVFGSSIGALIGLDLALRFPSQVRALVAHEPPLGQLTAEAQRQTASLPELYRQQGMAALRVFAASIGVDQGSAASAGPGSPTAAGNAKYFLEYDAPAVARYHLDITTLRRSPARVVVAAGQASRQYFPYQCAAALASLLGTDLVEFPGGHGALRRERPTGLRVRPGRGPARGREPPLRPRWSLLTKASILNCAS